VALQPRDDDRHADVLRRTRRAIEHDVENDYGVRVELVTVGDCVPDDRVVTLVAAGREAAINRGEVVRGREHLDLCRSRPTTISIFVRDRGVGFDLDAIPAIDGALPCRSANAWGNSAAKRRSILWYGSGSEVQLVMPRSW